MASPFDALLDPTGDAADTPEKAAALAAALKRQSRYGAIGQLMGVQPTQQVGGQLQEQAQGSLKMALGQRQSAREAAARAEERKANEDWRRMQYEQQERQNNALNQYRTQSLATRGQPTAAQTEAGRRADEKAEAAKAAALNAGVVKYGGELAGLQELQSAIEQADALIEPQRGSGNIKGVGGLSNQQGMIGNIAAKLEGGTDLRNALAPVRNTILKARSGGAVTPQEGDRLLTEFGQVMGASDADFLRAWDNFKARNADVLRGIESQYSPGVLEEYSRRRAAREAASAPRQPAPQQPAPQAPVGTQGAPIAVYDAQGRRVQ
jgi:hypothetical protein